MPCRHRAQLEVLTDDEMAKAMQKYIDGDPNAIRLAVDCLILKQSDLAIKEKATTHDDIVALTQKKHSFVASVAAKRPPASDARSDTSGDHASGDDAQDFSAATVPKKVSVRSKGQGARTTMPQRAARGSEDDDADDDYRGAGRQSDDDDDNDDAVRISAAPVAKKKRGAAAVAAPSRSAAAVSAAAPSRHRGQHRDSCDDSDRASTSDVAEYDEDSGTHHRTAAQAGKKSGKVTGTASSKPVASIAGAKRPRGAGSGASDIVDMTQNSDSDDGPSAPPVPPAARPRPGGGNVNGRPPPAPAASSSVAGGRKLPF
jgi:hypothetical protein